MKQKSLILVLGIIIGALAFGACTAFADEQIRLVINGNVIQSDVPPQVINGRTMVPIRIVAESLGAQVHWDSSSSSVIITSGSSNNNSGGGTTDFSAMAPYYNAGDAPVYNSTQNGALIVMAQNAYTSGIQLGSATWGTDVTKNFNIYKWNLGGKYFTLSAVLGLDDRGNGDNNTVVFEGDGRVLQIFHLSAGCMPQSISIPVSGINQLTIRTGQTTTMVSGEQHKVDLANATLTDN